MSASMNNKKSIINLPKGAESCFLAELISDFTRTNSHSSAYKKILVILPDQYLVQQNINELKYFNNNSFIINWFPDYEVLPYERISPTHEIINQRLIVLWNLQQQKSQIVFVSASALITAVAPISYLYKQVLFLNKKQKLNLDFLIKQLVSVGYTRVEQVYEAGEFAFRGGIIDVVIGKNKAVRIELCDDEIESLGYFDLNSQMIKTYVDTVELVPPTEYPNDSEGFKLFANNFKNYFPDATDATIRNYQQMGVLSGLEFYLPLFFNQQKYSILDYCDQETEIIVSNCMLDNINSEWAVVKQQYLQNQNKQHCLRPQDLFHQPDQLLHKIKQFKTTKIINDKTQDYYSSFLNIPEVTANVKDMSSWQNIINLQKKYQVYICAVSLGRSETIKASMAKFDIFPNQNLQFCVAPLQQGFCYKNVAYITEYNLFQRVAQSYQYNKSRNIIKNDSSIRDLSELTIGDFIVHLDYGIGIYQGVTQEKINNNVYDLINIEYKDKAFVGVPIGHLYKISTYKMSDQPAIDKLGAKKWQQIKQKIKKQVNDLATFLLQTYSDHAVAKGIICLPDDNYTSFANSFPYPLTKDQENTINDVMIDLSNSKAMDRLICGDVGFGKTEVAMRATYVVVANGYQVALIVPTTVLANQHYNTFVNRFRETAMVVVELSRFKTSKEIKNNLLMIKQGQADIIIATHRILQKDVEFANLGLLIIDEEHRFGVAQKEKLRTFRNKDRHIHILTMTATPIPRTLSMAIEGIKDFSIIATPPKKRLSVNTIVATDNNSVISEAIQREIRRGGQVFFLYNDVNSINNMYHRLSKLLPELQTAIAHGQMPERELEVVIRDFAYGRYQLLLCSTIIENGIDIPQANTIIIYHADRLGLSQLYQLRGRVGRSAHQAYCYLIVPEKVSKDAEKRINAIVHSQQLGSGFNLAIHDLEIRGAGEILGESQAGNLKNIGLSLYSEMLSQAIEQKRQDSKNQENDAIEQATSRGVEINLGVNAVIPASYCPVVSQRLVFYKKMEQCSQQQELDEVYQELVDAYGVAPEYVNNLLELNKLRILVQKYQVLKINANATKILIQFASNNSFNPDKLVALINKHAQDGMSFNTDNQLCYLKNCTNLNQRVATIQYILQSLY